MDRIHQVSARVLAKNGIVPRSVQQEAVRNRYKLSAFNVYVGLDHNTIGVYNTIHDSAVVLDSHTLNDLRGARLEDRSVIAPLVANHIVVPSELDEKAYFVYFLNKLKYSPVTASFDLCLTYDCNLSCQYCFQRHIESGLSMAPNTALRVLDFIETVVSDNPSIVEVEVGFTGGEALLNRSVMSRICEGLSSRKKVNRPVRFAIASNLTLLSQEDVNLFKEYEFVNVQVALDGEPSVHDSRRSLKSGLATFGVTMKNIGRLTKASIPVVIILNVDQHNADSFARLVPSLKNTLPADQLVFAVNPLRKSLYSRHLHQRQLNDLTESELFLGLYKLLRSENLAMIGLYQTNMICQMTTDVACTIDPSGRLYKCPMMLGNKEYATGSIFDDLCGSVHYQSLTREVWRNCLDEPCPYLPVCGGGCRFSALLKTGDIGAIDCTRSEYFGNVFKVVLKDELNDLLKGGDLSVQCAQSDRAQASKEVHTERGS